jgi:hypothetical protein
VRRNSEDISNTTKRLKPSPEQGTSEIGRSSENEEWREPTSTGADYGDMGSNGPLLSADITAQSKFFSSFLEQFRTLTTVLQVAKRVQGISFPWI